MNMEAMGIFGENLDMASKKSEVGQYSPSKTHNIEHSRYSANEELSSWQNQNSYANQTVISNRPKQESKDHKWKEAPVLGFVEKGEI